MSRQDLRACAGFVRVVLVLMTVAAVAACGNSKTNKFTVGGTASGLTGTVVLQNNGADDLSVSASGAFTFKTKVGKGKAYAVTVKTQPAGQTCAVANGSGTASANVTNVTVTCTTNPTYSIGGTVSGLGTGLSVVLQNNGGNALTVNANGAFAFTTKVAAGGAYNVTVQTQPAGQTCTVTNAAGNANADVTNVTVTCTVNPAVVKYSVGGTVNGLTSGTLQLRLTHPNGGAATTISVNAPGGAYNFDPEKVPDGETYTVTAVTQPAGLTCNVNNGSGTISGANVTNVIVQCSSTSTLYSIGGTINGLTGTGLKIEDGASNAVTVGSSDTTFTLPNKVASGYEFNVGISAQPVGQTCVLTKSHGLITDGNEASINVQCIANVTDPIVGTYTVPALSASNTSYVYITLFADGVYIYGSVENNGPNCGASTSPEGNGVEYGVYNYNASTHAFTIKSAVVDTNGGCGVWDNATNTARFNGTLLISGTGQAKTMTLTVGTQSLDLVPVDSVANQIIGSWALPYEKSFAVFIPAGGNNLYYLIAESQRDNTPSSTGQLAGIEYACASVTALTSGNLTADLSSTTCQAPAPSTDGPVDTNGTAGLSGAGGPVSFTVSTDTLTTPSVTLTRIKPN